MKAPEEDIIDLLKATADGAEELFGPEDGATVVLRQASEKIQALRIEQADLQRECERLRSENLRLRSR